MSKNAQTTQRAYMYKNIPYRYCYEEGGMIETEPGVFTRTYEVMPPGEEVKGSYNSKMTRIQTEELEKMKVRHMRILDSFSPLYEFE